MTNRIFIAAAWAVFMSITTSGPALAGEFQRQISVTGEGHVATVPDMATINLGVAHQAKEAGAAMAATSKATKKVLRRLTALGIAARDMQTSRLSLNPIRANRSSSISVTSKAAGFVAHNSVQVRVRDLGELGRIMDAVIGDGANDFSGLSFSVQQPEPLMDEARQKAVANAMARAQLLTSAAGVTLGPVLSMTEQGNGRPMMMQMADARSTGVPVAAGEVTISASVLMVFAIID